MGNLGHVKAHLARAQALLRMGHAFGTAITLTLSTTAGETIKADYTRSFRENDVKMMEAKITSIENGSPKGELAPGELAPIHIGMLITMPWQSHDDVVAVMHINSEVRRASRTPLQKAEVSVITIEDVWKYLRLKVKGNGEAFDLPQLNQLPPMQFRLHVVEGSVTDELLGEADLNNKGLQWPSAARYYAIRRAWVFCQMEAQDLRFPPLLRFQALWNDTIFFEFYAEQNAESGELVYSLKTIWQSHEASITSTSHPGASICRMHACVGEQGNSDYKAYHTKYKEAAIASLGGPSTKPIRPFKADGCSHDAIDQFGGSCWFVTVQMLLTKIQPLYMLVAKHTDVKEWLDRDRSNRKNSPASCQLDILPKGVYDRYRGYHKYEDSPHDFNFNLPRAPFSAQAGGVSYNLLRSTLLYCNVIPEHCMWTPIRWPLGVADTYHPDPEGISTSPELNEIKCWPVNYATSTQMGIMHVYNVSMHKKDFPIFVASKPTLLGGIVYLHVVANRHSRERKHTVPFTMCDRKAVICNWGQCSDSDQWTSLKLGSYRIADLLLIFGKEGTSQPTHVPESENMVLVLSNPQKSLHVHLHVDARTCNFHQVKGSVHQVFCATVGKVVYEHSMYTGHPPNVPTEGQRVTVLTYVDRSRERYQIFRYRPTFAKHVDKDGNMLYCRYYTGDISRKTLIEHMLKPEPRQNANMLNQRTNDQRPK